MSITQQLDDVSDFIFAYRFIGKTDHFKRFVAFQKDFFLGGLIKPAPVVAAKPVSADDSELEHEDLGLKLIVGVGAAFVVATAVSMALVQDKPPYQYKDKERDITVYPQTGQAVLTAEDKTYLAVDFAKGSACTGVLLKSPDKDSYMAVTSACETFNQATAPATLRDIETLRGYMQQGQQRLQKFQQR